MRAPNDKKKSPPAKGRASKTGRAPSQRDDADLFIDEVNEELQRERFNKLARTYGPWAIGGAVALVVGLTSYELYRSATIDAARDAGGAWLETTSPDAGVTEFEGLAAALGGDAAVLARLKTAEKLSDGVGEDDDRARASSIYVEIGADEGVAPAYRDLARIRAAMLGAETLEAETLITLLQPASAAGRPYRPIALELIAAAHLKAGRMGEARAALIDARDAEGATPTSVERASALLAAIEAADPSLADTPAAAVEAETDATAEQGAPEDG